MTSAVELSKPIQSLQGAVEQLPENSPSRSQKLNTLGFEYRKKFFESGETADIDKAIACHRQAVELSAAQDANYLDNLGVAFGERFLRLGDLADINQAIQSHQRAVDIIPRDSPDRPDILNNLGLSYHDRCFHTGFITDLEKAFSLHQEALDTTPENSPGRGRQFYCFALAYHDRYERLGSESDLTKAVELFQQATNIATEDNEARSGWLHNLGIALVERWMITGNLADLDQAIEFEHESIADIPEYHLDRSRRLDNLGLAYGHRYDVRRAISDLDEAIRLHQMALDLTPMDHMDHPRRLQSLGVAYLDRFQRTATTSDLDKAIQLHQESVDKTKESHSERPERLDNLGYVYRTKYLQDTAITENLAKAIEIHAEAVNTTPQESPDRPRRLDSLGLEYRYKFQDFKDVDDLNKAIGLHQEALDTTPARHPDRCDMLHHLGIGYQQRYQTTGEAEDLDKAIQLHKEALENLSSPLRSRLSSGQDLLRLCAGVSDWASAYQAAATTVSLIPQITPQSLENSDKQHLLTEAVGLASDAAAVALMASQEPSEAIRLLELGRGIIIGSLHEIRTDTSEVYQKSPELAEDYVNLRDQIDAPPSLSRQPDDRYKAAQKLEQTIHAIRSLPGLERFLLPPTDNELKATAASGPIVIINVSDYRCDALIIQASRLWVLPLPRLHSGDIRERSTILESPELLDTDLLEWLWDTTAEPILTALEFNERPIDLWPRIWWILTGPLARFPIHAAGYHSSNCFNTKSVLDRVVSSYSSSIKALSQSRQNHTKLETQRPEKVVLVGMKELQYAEEEIMTLEALCKSMQLQVNKPHTKRQDVLAALNNCDIFHFAGHGRTNSSNPSESGILLSDTALTVTSLFETNLLKHKPFLAYLSACGTGQIKNASLMDEGLHLIAACQLAGFQHVIGTLWEVNDKFCVDMAVMTYEWMKNHRMTDESVSEGLHNACTELRRRWILDNAARASRMRQKGQQEAIAGEELRSSQSKERNPRDVLASEDVPLYWVAYVHLGL